MLCVQTRHPEGQHKGNSDYNNLCTQQARTLELDGRKRRMKLLIKTAGLIRDVKAMNIITALSFDL